MNRSGPPFCPWLRRALLHLSQRTTLLCALALFLPAKAADYLNDFWQTNDGLPSNVVSDVIRDAEGFLWVATGNGLARFDGLHFEIHSLAQGVPGTQVHAVELDSQGRVWAGTNNGAAYLEGDRWHPVPGTTGQIVYSLGTTHDGAVWIGAYRACWRWQNGQLDEVSLPVHLPDVRAFSELPDGHLWVLSSESLCRIDPASLTSVETVPGPWIGKDLRDLCITSDGHLWVAGNGVLYRKEANGWENVISELPTGPDTFVFSCRPDDNGQLWLATRDSGILLYRDQQWSVLDARMGMVSLNDVRCLTLDQEGLIWAGTNGGGLNLLRRQWFETFTAPEGLGRTVTTSVAVGPDGSVWAGTDGGRLFQLQGNNFVQSIPDVSGSPFGAVRALLPRGDDSVWVATYDRGIYRFDRSSGQLDQLPSSDPSEPYSSLLEFHDGTVLSGSSERDRPHAFIERWTAEGNQGPATPEMPSFRRILDVLEDTQQRIWVATAGDGLWRFQKSSWDRIDDPNQGNLILASCLLETRDGAIWVGTLGQGLYRFNHPEPRHWTTAEGLVSQTVSQILEDQNGSLWLGTDTGLQRMDPTRPNTPAGGLLVLGRGDGLPSPQFTGEYGNLCDSDPEGRLWFALPSGAIRLDPAEIEKSQTTVPLYIESAANDSGVFWKRSRLSPSEPLRLEPGSGTLRIELAAPEFTHPQNRVIRYRMSGLENEWQELRGSRSIAYASLPPGKFRFEARVVETEEGSGSTASIDLVVIPHFWETAPFQMLVLLLLMTATGIGIRAWSLRKVRHKVLALRQARRVEAERSRIARDLHDDLGASLTEVNLIGTLLSNSLAAGDQKNKVDSIVSRARHMAKSLDEIVWTVNPANDLLSSTLYYLCSRVRESADAAGLRGRFEIDGDIPERSLDSRQRHHLLMAVNEAVNNALKHAHATEIKLQLSVSPTHIIARVIDNGLGFDPNTATHLRNGLGNMRSRMESVGGTMELESGSTGTTIQLTLPLEAPQSQRHPATP
ncbi:signal transduction histidine kinase/ligand-binding sensor domain-containing protein [Haloferula luteola]|uniref:Signal transduction histidine kinase/ligand-binding sensor domain-containing protein n=1 Tax=Haloferula luteola TaxID=595692 RepID=A0A840V6H4_9BACT|nr:sensor histidine kinase [Haloferula luteola]MBB5353572.1 signal transduction histidine kinase/ligand-binding sensor domain-containing protein [Haloferula luteola]